MENKRFIISSTKTDSGGVRFSKVSGALYTGVGLTPGSYELPAPIPAPAFNPGEKPAQPLPFEPQTRPWSYWGNDNLFPDDILAILANSTVGPAALNKRAAIHYGKGLSYYREVEQDGELVKKRFINPEIEAFLKYSKMKTVMPSLITDLEFFWNACPCIILSKDRKKINKVYNPGARWHRKATLNPQNGRIDSTYFSTIWPTPYLPYLINLPNYDERDPQKYKHFAYYLKYPDPTNIYYSLSSWNTVIANTWMPYVNNIPVLKSAIINNQYTIKYHIQIPETYWDKLLPVDLFPLGSRTRQAKIDAKYDEMDSFLMGPSNTAKSFMSTYSVDEEGKAMPGFIITVVPNQVSDAQYLPDSSAGDAQILFAMSIYPSLIGAGLDNGTMGAGSGAVIREAFWAMIATMDIQRHSSLDLMEFITDFNGWGNDIKWDYIDVDTSDTLDAKQPGAGNNETPINMAQDKKAKTVKNKM